MVSQHEREKLTEAFKREPLTGAAVVFKCVAGLMVVAGLAVIGARMDMTDATATAANQPRPQATLFQERQTRLEPAQAEAASQIFSTNAADARNPSPISSLTQHGAAPVNSLQN